MGKSRYKLIPVRLETSRRLEELMYSGYYRTWDELINALINSFYLLRELKVKDIVCNHLSDAKASPLGWKRLLSKYGIDLADAILYLKYIGDNDFTVNKEKCNEPLKINENEVISSGV